MLTKRTMIACVDVDYRDDHAVAACVLFRDWLDAEPAAEWTHRVAPVAPYQPGQFYRRELPCLLAVLAPRLGEVGTVVVDGYFWLRDEHSPGLGAQRFGRRGGRHFVDRGWNARLAGNGRDAHCAVFPGVKG